MPSNKKKTESIRQQEQPQHKHDCEACLFLGTCEVKVLQNSKIVQEKHDLYICEEKTLLPPTLLVRWSNEPQDYFSIPMKYVDKRDPTLKQQFPSIIECAEKAEKLFKFIENKMKQEQLKVQQTSQQEKKK